MTGREMESARAVLGDLWGYGRPLHMRELAKALRLAGPKPSDTIREYERGKPISGPIAVCIEMWLAGATPPEIG